MPMYTRRHLLFIKSTAPAAAGAAREEGSLFTSCCTYIVGRGQLYVQLQWLRRGMIYAAPQSGEAGAS
jgi:hypothetical protein